MNQLGQSRKAVRNNANGRWAGDRPVHVRSARPAAGKTTRLWATIGCSLALLVTGMAHAATTPWAGTELPLPLVVRTPADLEMKAVIERQYLVFNLLARGKQAFDAGDFAQAADAWESLLKTPGLDPEVARVLRPFATTARQNAKSGRADAVPKLTPPAPVSAGTQSPAGAATAPASSAKSETATFTVSGQITGGGSVGPSGAVLWLRRLDGSNPRVQPARGKFITQTKKTFVPRVLAVPVGTRVEFKNQDELYHNVFSLGKPNDFDTGLYKGGESYSKVFTKPGAVQILCNIHASMLAYVVVVETPHHAQPDASGAFVIKNVPAGTYEVEVWHESASTTTKSKITVNAESGRNLQLAVGADKRRPGFVPDKYGKPRQTQLGY